MKFSPGSRLILITGFTAAFVSAAGLILNLSTLAYSLVICVLAGAALLDLSISMNLPKRLAVEFPEVIKMSKNRQACIQLGIKNQLPFIKKIKIGIAFPGNSFKALQEKTIFLKKETTKEKWDITATQQGEYLIEDFWLQLRSRMGFWDIKRRTPIQCMLNVYPDMSGEKKHLAALFTSSAYGAHARKSIGKGREFERLREYLPGDIYEDIHWKATARRGVPVTKIFQIEKTQDVYVMIDASRLSARNAAVFCSCPDKSGKTTESILEKYITATLSTGLAAQRQGDKFGLGVFTDKMERFIPAGSKKTHYNLCRDGLFTLRPRQVTPDFNEWISFVGNKIRKRSLLILLTSLDDSAVADSLLSHIHILSRRHLVMVNTLQPSAARPLFSSDQVRSVDEIYDHLGGHLQWHSLLGFEKSLHRMGICFYQHALPDLTFNIISRYLEIKQRQAL